MNKEKRFISAVIYVHNAENKIEKFLKTIVDVFERCFEHSEVICVNDNSTDGSVQRIKEVSRFAGSSGISIVNMSYFHGLEVAMNAGIDFSIGDYVFEFDSTILDFEQEEIMNVYRQAMQGYDIVSAVPKQKENFTSKLFYGVFDKLVDYPYKMRTERFRILSRRVINRINSTNNTILYRKVTYASQGMKADSIYYVPRTVKKEKRTKYDRLEKKYRSRLAVDSLILFTEVGYRFSMKMTVLMMLVSVFMIVYSVVIFATSHPVEGWTTTILFLSVVFFGLFAILTITTRYLKLMVNLLFKRKHYSFESIDKLTKV